MSRFTILGGSGAIGRRLIAHLAARGVEVFAPARGDDAIFSRPLGHVIDAIGITADFRTRPLETVEAHVCVLREILARANFSSLLYLSSTRVYATLPPGEIVDEDTLLRVDPNSASDLYNLSKIMGESLCLHCGHAHVRAARLSNVVGGDDQDSQNFIPALIAEAKSGRIVLRSARASAKDYIHIDDVAALLPEIAVRGRARLYNVASGIAITNGEWADAIAARTGCTIEETADAPVLRFPPISIARIREEFGASPRHALDIFMQSWTWRSEISPGSTHS